MKQVESNLTRIHVEIPVNYQVSANNGYSTDENTEYLEKHGFDGYISSRTLKKRKKREIYPKNHFKRQFQLRL